MSRDQLNRLAAGMVLLWSASLAAAQEPERLPPPLSAPPAALAPPAPADVLPPYLPQYKVEMDVDVAGHTVHFRQRAGWTNPCAAPTQQLVFNAHSRYVVPDKELGFMAKMLEILRVPAGDGLGYTEPPLEVHTVTLVAPGQPPASLPFRYEGDTKTTLVVDLPYKVGPGEGVTVLLDATFHLPQKMGRWGQWEGVTFLSNWLPVFAYYGPPAPPANPYAAKEHPAPAPPPPGPAAPPVGVWQPTPFVPWHQPFFNESGVYHVSAVLPCDQVVGCTGQVVATTPLGGGKNRVDIEAVGVREFTILCSARYQVHEGVANAGPGGRPVRIRILALPEHAFFAREMVRIAQRALTTYSQWFGPYPWPDFTIPECYFGWNGNECSGLVMIDERVFGMPHLGVGYVEYLVSHEICHQWWYNLVGTNGYCETWMDEAMANYFSHRLLNRCLGRENNLLAYPSGLEWLPNIRREDYRSIGMYSTFAKGESTPIIQELTKFGHLGNLFNLCYDKGGRVVGMIEERLGEAAFMDFIHALVNKYRYRILRVADFQRELAAYTGPQKGALLYDWDGFFKNWLYETGLCDWAVGQVVVSAPPKVMAGRDGVPGGPTTVEVYVEQRGAFNEMTSVGFALPGHEGYPIRVPLLPSAGNYEWAEAHAKVTTLPPGKNGGARMKVEIALAEPPTQVAVDPDQVLVDAQPDNNTWKKQVKYRVTPLYTFLDETDLTCAYDRWNVIAGPWVYGAAYNDPWFTRTTMLGLRAGLYRTQEFDGGVYTAYRTDYRDVVAGVDGLWDHTPWPHTQLGFVAERRLLESESGDATATRAALYLRWILTYGSSLYLPPFQYIDFYAHYTDNFYPYASENIPGGVRFDRMSTLGLHYKLNYLTPYWDPQGGIQAEAWYEGGVAELPSTVGVQMVSGQVSTVKSVPNVLKGVDAPAWMKSVSDWLGDTRMAFRIWGATSAPGKGEFFSMGGSYGFRGFDLAQRQGSSLWVGSVEWRVPVVQRVEWDALDHMVGLRNAYVAMFYDVGDTYVSGRQVGPVANAVGAGLRLDVAWLSFVERTTIRLDIAQAINTGTGVQLWFGITHPF